MRVLREGLQVISDPYLGGPIAADIRVAETLDALFVTPHNPSLGTGVAAALKRSVPLALRRTGDGLRVPAAIAITLPSHVPGLDLRWGSDARRFIENRQLAVRATPGLLQGLQLLKARGVDYAKTLVADSAGLTTLDDHQIVNVAAMTLPGGYGLCVFDEQGAGKTVTFIFAYDLLVSRDEADFAVIVAPKSMIPEWPKDFVRFRGDLYRVAVVTGSAREKRHALQSEADVIVTNFETAVLMEDELKAMFRSRAGRGILTIDESFFIKSLDAKRTRALRRLREWCGRAFVLCGTPAPNAPQDLVQQFNLMDFGTAFDAIDLPDDRTEAAPIVQDIIDRKGLYIRHLKADVLPDLPQKQFQRIFVPLEPIQRQVYESALKNLVLDLECVTEDEFRKQYANFLARRAALIQTCSNPGGVAQGYSETPAKILALDGILQRLIEIQREKVVVWSFYTDSVSAIVKRYGRYGALRYDGQVTHVAERREAVRRFQEDDDAMLFVANPAAAGAGLTLHRARIAVYESLSNQAAHYLQSLDRIHRRGQTRPVDYLVLLCDGTIELQEYDRLVQKEVAAQSLLGDRVSAPLTRETMLIDARAATNLLRATEE